MPQAEDKIELTETMSIGIRVFLFIVGLFPWIVPYEFFIKHHWNRFSLAMLFFLVISLGAVSVSLAFIGEALFGLNQTITFALSARTVTHHYETAINALRTKRYSFHDITKIEVHEHDWDTGPHTYSLEIHFKDRHKLLFGNFSSRKEAEDVQMQIR